VSQEKKESVVQKIVESHTKAIDAKREAYKYDLRQDTISSYIGKIYKRNVFSLITKRLGQKVKTVIENARR
jgi:hypothetical protein